VSHAGPTEPLADAGPAPALSRATVRWYALGQSGIGAKSSAKDFLVFFYTQVIGLSGSLAGIAVLCTSIIDALSDPIVGAYSDRTQSRWGRRHPYMVAAVLPYALVFYLLWVPPMSLGQLGLFLWLMVTYALLQLCLTVYHVPYLALGAEISDDYDERTHIVMQRSVWDRIGRSIAGTLILLVFFRATTEYPNGQLNPEAYPRFALLFAILMPIVMFAAAWKTRDRIPHLRKDHPPAGVHPLRSMIRDMRDALQYRAFRSIFAAHVAMNIGWGVTGMLGLHMMTYFWKVDTNMLFIWGVGMTAGVFVGLPFWARRATHIDKKATYMWGLTLYILFMATPCLLRALGFWVAEGSTADIVLYVTLTGFVAHFGLCAGGVVTGSMLADIADLDELTHGRRREGIFFGVESFGGKMLTGMGSVVAGFIIDLVGVASLDPADATPEVGRNLGLAFGGAVFVFMCIATVCISFYDLNHARHDRIRAELFERRAADTEAFRK
jgi:GPH family glycoside/pentoside/hexuronide:cation symporter